MLTLVSRAVERGASITKWTAENKFANWMPGSGRDAASYKEEKFAKWFFLF
jgi:hypothetical protein